MISFIVSRRTAAREKNSNLCLSVLCRCLFLSLAPGLFVSLISLSAIASQADEATTQFKKTSQGSLTQQLLEQYALRRSCVPQAPLEVRLQTANPPVFNKPVQLLLSVLPLTPLSNTEITWELDAGVEVIQGQQRQDSIKLASNVLAQFPLMVRFTKPGVWAVTASVIERVPGGTMGRRLSLYFAVSEKDITVTEQRPWKETLQDRQARPIGKEDILTLPDPMLGQFALTLPPRLLPTSDDRRSQGIHPQGTARVKGKFFYRHHDGTLHSAWNSVAQIWDRDSFSGDDLLAEAIINTDGTFDSGDFDNGNDTDPWPFTSAQDVYIYFVPHNSRIQVLDAGSGDEVIISGPNLGDNISDGLHDIGGWQIDGTGPGTYPDNGWESAFEICETATREWLHYRYDLGYDISSVDIRWKPGESGGAYYNGSIHLTDGDQYDPSVILHEYGHHVMDVVKGGMPPNSGGTHYWFDPPSNGATAWSEGWATYSGQSTLNSPNYSDTAGVGSTNVVQVNIETTTGNHPDASAGTITESSVLSCLWDIYDNLPNDPHTHDYAGLGWGPVWDTFVNGGTFNHIHDFLYAFMGRYPGDTGYTRWWAYDHHITLTSAEAGDFYVDQSYTGPEFGTPAQPYRSVAAALNAAIALQSVPTNIYIRAGNYSEYPTTSKPVTFLNWTGSGLVSIGTP